ncbi:hypothetical protein KCU71_g779, partial [Aureobasidium melanogenum]
MPPAISDEDIFPPKKRQDVEEDHAKNGDVKAEDDDEDDADEHVLPAVGYLKWPIAMRPGRSATREPS